MANDSPLERLHVPRRGSDLRAKPEHYQMVVSEHQRRLQHMLNWQFEPPRRRLRSKSLTCNVALRTGPSQGSRSFPSVVDKQLWVALGPAVSLRDSAFCLSCGRTLPHHPISSVALSARRLLVGARRSLSLLLTARRWKRRRRRREEGGPSWMVGVVNSL